MSYVSLLKNIPEILSQPTGIAAIASLGIHGAIALIVPLMPVDSNKSSTTDSSKVVGLMELSPADQNRLPQTPDTSKVALQQPQLPLQQQLPPANFDSQLTTLPPLEAPLPNQAVLPPIPTSSGNYNLSYLPRSQPSSRFTRNDFSRQVSNFQARSNFSPSVSPFVNDLDSKIRETEPLNLNRLPQVEADNKIPEQPLNNPSPDPIDIGSSTPQEVSQPQKMQLGDKLAQNSPSEVPGEQSLAANDQLALAGQGLPPLPETATKKPPELPAFKQLDSQGKTTQQLLANLNSYNKLRTTIKQEYPNAKEQAVIRETISTDKQNLEGNVLGRLVVDSDGKVLDIKFQDRSVAPELQSKAREFFNANPPKTDKRTSSYPFHLRFKNQNNSNIPEGTSEPKPSPNNNSEKAPEPQNRKIQPSTPGVVIIKTSPTATVSSTQPAPSSESTQKLIQQLRQLKEQKQNSNQEQ
ncbi:hypothetical protein [Anabaena lutea]|uniref:TonB C-terminal domain-containing protein n=1 Tax=Anabaena lutea FACHB-196 TaxID=2692881 RepID=A0ABR8F9Y1_9NOST|nr:hypothetical protein [Anabaena lutea]MBD2567003.1 hypothetical protein [Anabaena lutea FACHB-196]